MIKSVEFSNFRNLSGKRYDFAKNFNLIIGENSSGKTNLLDGIKLAFSVIDGSYTKILQSDFTNSDDTNPLEIKVLLEYNSIPSLNLPRDGQDDICGFKVVIHKTPRGAYRKLLYNYDGSTVNIDIVTDDGRVPSVFSLPMRRIEDIYSDYASIGLDKFIDSDEKYVNLKNDFSESTKERLESEITAFRELCKKYGQNFDIEINGAKMSGESVYVVNGNEAHNRSIGAGYKSIANIILNTTGGGYSVILVDEIENHLHPALLRTLIQQLKLDENIFVVSTTHSPVAINQVDIEEVISIGNGNVGKLIKSEFTDTMEAEDIISKLNVFLHPGRNELMLAHNVVVVEGFSEELVLRSYIAKNNSNFTVVNAHGVMFRPYLTLAKVLGKKVVAVSDNDRSESNDGESRTTRFTNLKSFCNGKGIAIREVDNTFETDIYNNGYCEDNDELENMLKPHSTHASIMVAKSNTKTKFALQIIKSGIDLSDWHVIKDTLDEFESH